MSKKVFFSFCKKDWEIVQAIKERADDPSYMNLNFKVEDLLKRRIQEEDATIKKESSASMERTSRTIVLVGKSTYKNNWVAQEVQMTLEQRKPVYAIYLSGSRNVKIPKFLSDNGIYVYTYSEARLQQICTL